MTASRNILVTGGSGGIGWPLCQSLRAKGHTVVCLDRNPPPQADVVHYYQVDLADPAQLTAVLKQACSDHVLTGLVNNAGTLRPALVDDTTVDDFELTMAVNARAAMQCTQALLPAMRAAHNGRIVNISSRAALGKELRTAYSASKGALNAMTRTWALELGQFGITVNAVAPGPIATAGFASVNPSDDQRTKRIIAGVAVGRLGTPDDVGHAVEFFLSDRASFITGQVLSVCGGITVGLTS